MALAITIVIALVVIVALSIYLVRERRDHASLKRRQMNIWDIMDLESQTFKDLKDDKQQLKDEIEYLDWALCMKIEALQEHLRNHLNCVQQWNDLTEGPCIKPSPKSLS